MRKSILILLLALSVAGCAPWIGMHNIEPGMTKSEVLQQMGKPSNSSGSGNEEYLWYIPVNRFWERYYVHLVDGEVEAYGMLGNQDDTMQ